MYRRKGERSWRSQSIRAAHFRTRGRQNLAPIRQRLATVGTRCRSLQNSFPRTQRDDDENAEGGLRDTGYLTRNAVFKCRGIHPREVGGQPWLMVINHRIDDDDKYSDL